MTMANYLIEVPHEETRSACLKAVQIFMASGSHFITNAEWGCADQEHKAWLIVDVESKKEARQIVPPTYREQAKITKLFRVNPAEFEKYKQDHPQDFPEG